MKSLEQHLIKYALYHRDKRNIATHFIGVPLIVFAVVWLTFLPLGAFFQAPVSLSACLILLVSIYYLALSPTLGSWMIAFLLLCQVGAGYAFAAVTQAGVDVVWFYVIGLVLFVTGWVIQFVGHYFEGKKPAFADDLMGLLIGPLFVMMELLNKIGCFKALEQQVNKQAGPYRP
ncbi:Mpo1-like protein [Pseudoalteromonas sp. OOF1S-7]|uniref:Mpo1 family 2-hydroxy fatty acid dioxygenase n=1 Tax=Pseudoalteromonas sp. OOF1S-7 TaxID=2917757 RepID=UPI001EF4CA4B|nr:Mpo1-like protein [Pseudoalteromonas sp. OOF1S-7]MCG7533661.1 DUF962 domain-containing protein [Pseudoalteromonas sp. OOF1S-7]